VEFKTGMFTGYYRSETQIIFILLPKIGRLDRSIVSSCRVTCALYFVMINFLCCVTGILAFCVELAVAKVLII
jgi:hypothetical protein